MKRLAAFLRLASFLTLAGFILCSQLASAREERTESRIATVRLAELPPEARATLALVKQGGPFPHPRKDGGVFGNFEGRLPERPRGHYREYTVPTPGSPDRGARRIVAAGSDEYYYTPDHYRSFRRIQEPP